MVITTYACPLCQRAYDSKGDVKIGESCCAKKSEEISILGLTKRTYNILKIAGIDTVDEARSATESDLLTLKGFGQASLHELQYKLQPFGGYARNK